MFVIKLVAVLKARRIQSSIYTCMYVCVDACAILLYEKERERAGKEFF